MLPSLCSPSPCLNRTISHPPVPRSWAKYSEPLRQLHLHLLSVRDEGEGHARRSWHQPVTPPFPLPPSVSLLNQITPHTCTHKPISQSMPILNLAPFALLSCQLSLRMCEKNIQSQSNWQRQRVHLHAFFVFVRLDDFARVCMPLRANSTSQRHCNGG